MLTLPIGVTFVGNSASSSAQQANITQMIIDGTQGTASGWGLVQVYSLSPLPNPWSFSSLDPLKSGLRWRNEINNADSFWTSTPRLTATTPEPSTHRTWMMAVLLRARMLTILQIRWRVSCIVIMSLATARVWFRGSDIFLYMEVCFRVFRLEFRC